MQLTDFINTDVKPLEPANTIGEARAAFKKKQTHPFAGCWRKPLGRPNAQRRPDGLRQKHTNP